MHRRIQKTLAVVVLATLVLPSGLKAFNTSNPQDTKSNPIRECLSKMVNPRLAVQFLIDESKSLQNSDPTDQRVDAINSSIAALTFNFADVDEKNDKAKIEIDVRLSGFAKKFDDHNSEWIALSQLDNATLFTEVEKFRSRDNQAYTNYLAGLEGAERLFVEYDRDRGGETACKVLIWLTDGNIDLDNSSANQSKEDKQKNELCESGGVVDRLRSQKVFVVGLGLNSNGSKKQDFSLMSRMLEGGCGERDPYGRFTEVGSADQLIQEMFRNLLTGNTNEPVPCRGEEQNNDCREVRFSVRPPLSRINVLVGLTKEIDTAVVINPQDETVSFAEGGRALPVQENRVQSMPSFDLSTILKIDVHEMPGEWRLQFRGPGAANALVMSIFFSDVVVEIKDLPLRIDRREPAPITVSLGDLGLEGFGELDEPGTIADFDEPVKVLAELSLGSSLVTGEVRPVVGASGDFEVLFSPQQLENAPSNGVLTLTPVAVLGGQEINFTPRSEDVVLVLGNGFPTIEKVSATDIDGDGKSEVKISLVGPEEGTGSARVLPKEFVATEVPPGHEVSEANIQVPNEAPVSIAAGKSGAIQFEVKPTFAANGRFTGEIQIELKNEFGETQTQKIAFDFNMTKPFDTQVFLWALIVMLISFLLVQGAIVFVAVDRLSRIAKVPTETYFARFSGRITETGTIEVVSPSTWKEVLKSSTDPVTSNVSGKRRYQFKEFTIFGSRSAGLRWLVAGGDSALRIAWPGNVVVGSRTDGVTPDRTGRVAAHLAGEWAVAVGNADAEALASSASDPDATPGTYIDHLTGDIREFEKNPSIEGEFIYFLPNFAAENADELVDDMVMNLSIASIREMIAAAGAEMATSSPSSVPADSSVETSASPFSTYSSIEDEYG